MISQIFIWGSSFESYNVAIIVPERDEFLKTFKCDYADFEVACSDNKNKTRFNEIINDFGRQNGLKGFEVIKSVHLDPDPFSVRSIFYLQLHVPCSTLYQSKIGFIYFIQVENGLLTPTQKAKRPMIKRKYEDKLKELYANGPLL